MSIKETIKEQIIRAVGSLWPDSVQVEFDIEYPPRVEFGDYSANIAMKLASRVGEPPRKIAEMLAEKLTHIPHIERVTVEGGGFVNFFLDDAYLKRLPHEILTKKETYASHTFGKKQHVNVEFISANPTGPLTFANGRGGFFGDTLARVLEKCGYIVEREYFVNDAGNQINILAESVLRKYFTQSGIPTDYPEYCYQGAYVDELAKKLHIPNYNIAKTSLTEIRDKIKDKIVAQMLKDIKRVITEKMKLNFDTFYSERLLHEKNGAVDVLLERLKEMKITYEKDGALWLKSIERGDDKDRVLIKKDGEYTYLLPDIAYHLEKFEKRGFDKVIDILGADHHGYVDRMYAAMDFFGYKNNLTIIISQMVKLMDNGTEVKMSKRAGTYITIEEVIDDVGIDATRFFFLLYAPNTHMDFDRNLAKEHSDKNPVYYVQYAHARMCSILTVVEERKKTLLKKQEISTASRKVLQYMDRWPEAIAQAARTSSVHSLAQFALDASRAVHEWYDKERVVSSEGEVHEQLLEITKATKVFLQDILFTLGVSTPERME